MTVEPIEAPERSTVTVGQAAASVVPPRFFYGWRIVVAAFVASFTTAGIQAYVAGSFLAPMSDDLGWTRAQFLYGQTLGQFVMAFAGFFIGAYVDRWGARPLMLAGAVILATTLVLVSMVTELWQWIFLRGTLSMLGTALLGNLVVNVTISKWFVEKRGQAVGLASMGVSFAGIVLPSIVTLIIDEYGWRAGWRFLAGFVLAFGIPAALTMRRSPEDIGLHPDGKSEADMAAGGGAAAISDYAHSFTRKQALRTSTLYVLVVAFGLGSLGLSTMIIITIPYLSDSGFDRGFAALMVTTLAIPAAVTKPAWGYLGDRWSERLSTAATFVLNAGALVLVVAATAAHAELPLIVGYLLVGAGIGGQIPLQESIWATYFGRRYIGAVRSVAMPLTMLFSAAGPLIVAASYDRFGSYDGALYGVAAGWAIAAVVIMFVRRPVYPGPAEVRASA